MTFAEGKMNREKTNLLAHVMVQAVSSFFTSAVEIPGAHIMLHAGMIYWEPDENWLKPWRIVKVEGTQVYGYPCGEPK